MSVESACETDKDESGEHLRSVPSLFNQLSFWEKLVLPYRSVHPLCWITVPFYAGPELRHMLQLSRRLQHLYDLHSDRHHDPKYRTFGPSYKKLEQIIKNSPNYFRNKDQ